MKLIEQRTVAQLEAAPNFQALLDEYGRESRMRGMPEPRAKMPTYRTLEASGQLVCFGAYIDDWLCGFVTVLTYELQHYSAPASVSESIFVSEPFRKTGAGLDLIRAAKQYARNKGAHGLLVSAPTDSALMKILAASKDCEETNRVYFFTFQQDAVTTVGPTNELSLEKLRKLETEVLKLPQVSIETNHVFHADMYARTCKVPAGVLMTGALIKVATLLIIEGDCIVYIDDKPVRLEGYNVLSASAGRKQAFLAMKSTNITMVFPTKAKTIEEAEEEFTDEAESLQTRNNTLITEDRTCLVQ